MAKVTAWLVAFYALEILVPVIDIFGLPLPRYVSSFSFSACFILAALGILIPLAKQKGIPVLGLGSLGLLGMLGFWGGIEMIHYFLHGHLSLGLIMDFMPLLLVMAASGMHLMLFGGNRILVTTLVLTASAMLLLHTALLLGASFDLPMLFVDLPPDFSTGMKLVKSAFEGRSGHEEAVHGRADHRISQAG